MPDTLSLSAGVSLGLLAGIVSGVCYLFANGKTWPKNERVTPRRCIAPPRATSLCHSCGGEEGGPLPCICYQQPVKFESGAWFLTQVHRAVSLMPWSLSTDKLDQIEEEECDRDSPGPSDSTRGELRTIREFLETISAKLAGGPLEGTRVAPLYDHPAYLPARNASSVNSAPVSASGAHVQLKRLVARVVEEAASLPALQQYAAEPQTPNDSSTYEDLLATAILNKVIERYQNENGSGGRSSGIHSASASPSPSETSTPRSLNSRITREITPPLREEDDVSDWEEGDATDEAQELPKRGQISEFGGDVGRQKDNDERDFDEVSGSDLQTIDGTWEENWLFQKKKIKTIQSVPVPMLVPNSNTEYRALIGDRDADDTTDLSDNASEGDDEEFKSDMKRVLESKHVIGGQLRLEDETDFEPDSLTIIDNVDEFEKLVGNEYKNNDRVVDAMIDEINDSNDTATETVKETNDYENKDSILVLGIDSGPLPKAEFSVKEEIHRTMFNGNIENCCEEQSMMIPDSDDVSVENFDKNESTNTLRSQHEREGEYEETVTIPVQRYADSLRRKHFDDTLLTESSNNANEDDELIPGSIAYRERKKWLNYVDMPNNPYSPEAIKKRLSTKSTSSLFDMITTQTKDLDNEQTQIIEDHIDGSDKVNKEASTPARTVNYKNLSLAINTDNSHTNERGIASPSTGIMKDMLVEDETQYKRYGRDYYIKEAKTSSGCRKKNSFSDTSSMSSMNKSTSLDNFDSEFASPGLLIKQFNMIATNQQYTKFCGKDQPDSFTTIPCNKDEIQIEYEDTSEQLFSAKPAYVDDETDRKLDEILHTAYNQTDANIELLKSPTDLSMNTSIISSSSMEDSIKIYNVQTGEIMKCKPDNVSSRYEFEADSNENIDIADKNIPGDTTDSRSQNFDTTDDTLTDDEKLETSELEDLLPQLPKVKELAKKFVSMDNLSEHVKIPQPYSKRRRSKENILVDRADKPINKQLYMHSLTARSISKEFREELKLSLATPLTVPGGVKEVPEGTEEITKESSRPGSPLPEPGTIKTKLAFFESLKNKFSNK